MQQERGRGIRPWLWLFSGVVGVVAGVVLGIVTLGAVGEPADLSGVPVCAVPYAASCRTSTPATVVRRGYVGRGYIAGEQKWLLEVPAGTPALNGDRWLEVTLPHEPGRGALRPGLAVTVTFYGRRAAAVVLPSQHSLETEDHPQRYWHEHAYWALFALGLGGFGARTGWRTGRRRGWWRKTSQSDMVIGPAAVVGFSGMLGALAQSWTAAALPPLVVAGACLIGLSWLMLRQRSRVRPGEHSGGERARVA